MSSLVEHRRVWRSAPFPSGILYWEEPRFINYPVNRREAEALRRERWIPLYKIEKKS